jgi:hypothetical protein
VTLVAFQNKGTAFSHSSFHSSLFFQIVDLIALPEKITLVTVLALEKIMLQIFPKIWRFWK